jgi:hypothetical protein
MWGTLPLGSSILAIFLLLFIPDRVRVTEPVEVPSRAGERVYARQQEVRP